MFSILYWQSVPMFVGLQAVWIVLQLQVTCILTCESSFGTI